MKKYNSRIISIVLSVFIAASGFISLLINEVFAPFLDSQSEVKLIIILVSVLSAYHVFLTFTLKALIKSELENTNNNIDCIEAKIGILNNAIPFAYLDDIERHHGSENKNINCEMWIIANTIQEAKNDDLILHTIYDNITLNRVHYFYVLPKTQTSEYEIHCLNSRLKEIHKKKKSHRTITGGISYKIDDSIANHIASEYFDIVLFIDCDEQGTPYVIGNSPTCEGYQCYSKISQENKYFYQPIDADKIFQIRSFYKSMDFNTLNLQEIN